VIDLLTFDYMSISAFNEIRLLRHQYLKALKLSICPPAVGFSSNDDSHEGCHDVLVL